jgi:hypothetical protein
MKSIVGDSAFFFHRIPWSQWLVRRTPPSPPKGRDVLANAKMEVDGEDDRENRAVPRAPKAAAEELGPAQASHFVAARTNSSRRDARTAASSLMVAIGLQKKKGKWIGSTDDVPALTSCSLELRPLHIVSVMWPSSTHFPTFLLRSNAG